MSIFYIINIWLMYIPEWLFESGLTAEITSNKKRARLGQTVCFRILRYPRDKRFLSVIENMQFQVRSNVASLGASHHSCLQLIAPVSNIYQSFRNCCPIYHLTPRKAIEERQRDCRFSAQSHSDSRKVARAVVRLTIDKDSVLPVLWFWEWRVVFDWAVGPGALSMFKVQGWSASVS